MVSLIYWTVGTLAGMGAFYGGAYALSRWRAPWDLAGSASAGAWARTFRETLIRLLIAWVWVWTMIGIESAMR